MKNIYGLSLPYYKQGDDLGNFLEVYRDDPHPSAPSLLGHAEMLEHAANSLRRLAALAADGMLTVEVADCHYIEVECDTEIADKLIADNILHHIDHFDEGFDNLSDMDYGDDFSEEEE